jgi:hypothetical protein
MNALSLTNGGMDNKVDANRRSRQTAGIATLFSLARDGLMPLMGSSFTPFTRCAARGNCLPTTRPSESSYDLVA